MNSSHTQTSRDQAQPFDAGDHLPGRSAPSSPEHLPDVVHAQVNHLEGVVPGAAQEVHLVRADAQGGHLAFHRDHLSAAGLSGERREFTWWGLHWGVYVKGSQEQRGCPPGWRLPAASLVLWATFSMFQATAGGQKGPDLTTRPPSSRYFKNNFYFGGFAEQKAGTKEGDPSKSRPRDFLFLSPSLYSFFGRRHQRGSHPRACVCRSLSSQGALSATPALPD